MAVLKKIKSTTLMETLVATAIIVINFMMASVIMNNLFSKSIQNNTGDIEAYLNELKYQIKNEQLVLPYFDSYNNWDINIEKFMGDYPVKIEATNPKIKKVLTNTFYE